ncbi:hypothetical protein [Lysobacter enzymogenes]|uniref:hypothetical protein n=1 Tax=Lysobacter enzymogenes TaxID=69 RepID=UPI001A95E193|nr:hypothetical protein [Lysobacter enzymogenes]QQP95207.1 hypothetical protein JHW38_18480 [Lysobacter enzymogenes]
MILFATLFLSACDPAIDRPPLLQTGAASGRIDLSQAAPRASVPATAAVSAPRIRG